MCRQVYSGRVSPVDTSGFRAGCLFCLCGAASRNQSVLLKLSDAYKIRQDVNPDLLLGGVAYLKGI